MISSTLILIFVVLLLLIICFKIWEYYVSRNQNRISDKSLKTETYDEEKIRQQLTVKTLVLSKDCSDNSKTDQTEETTSTDIESQDSIELYSDEKECAVCLNEFEDGCSVSVSNNNACQHIFHDGCIVQWLKRERGCPCCRTEYLVIREVSDELVLSDA